MVEVAEAPAVQAAPAGPVIKWEPPDQWVGYGPAGTKITTSYDKKRTIMMMGRAGFPNCPIVEPNIPGGPVQTRSLVTGIREGGDEEDDPDDLASLWPVHKRFQYLHEMLDMIARDQAVSMVITGNSGVGKTHETIDHLTESCGYEDISALSAVQRTNEGKTFRVMKGFTTAKGLYRTLYENAKGLMIFDDFDEALKDPDAAGLLKGALDSYDRRIICWNADMRDEDLTRQCVYTGRIIFVTNLSRRRLREALITRSYVIDVKLTPDEMIARMRSMVENPKFMPGFSKKHKEEAMELIEDTRYFIKDMSLRTLKAVIRIRAAKPDNLWEELSHYVITN